MTDLPPIPADAPKRGTLWRHYKGKTYQVMSVGRHSDDGQIMVIYLDEQDGVWCRPLNQWREIVPEHGCYRFTEIP